MKDRFPAPSPVPFRIIGREKERTQFAQWLCAEEKPTQIFFLTGLGGIGKTTLAKSFARQAREHAALTLWLDGNSCLPRPPSVLSSLEMVLASEYGRVRGENTPLLSYIADQLSAQTTLIIFDNFERMSELEDWLLHYFFAQLPRTGVLLLFASRTEVPVKWLADPYWKSFLYPFHLDLWSRQEVKDYLNDYALPDGTRWQIAQQTEGYPLWLSLVTNLELYLSREQMGGALSLSLSAELLREVLDPSLYEGLEVLSLLPFADQAMISRLLCRPVDGFTYQSLCRLSFIESSGKGLVLHPVVGRILRNAIRETGEATYRDRRRQAVQVLAAQFEREDVPTQVKIAAHVLEIYREYLPPSHPYADFSSVSSPATYRPFSLSELNQLHRLLAMSVAHGNWQCEWVRGEAYHALLDEMAHDCPEGIFVSRSDEGEVLGFSAGLWLDRHTLSLTRRYAPMLYAYILETEGEARGEVPPEAADSLYVLLSAVDEQHPLYRVEELGSRNIRGWLSSMTLGRRGVVPTADPHLARLLHDVGFEKKSPPAGSRFRESDVAVWELDFRQASFPQWVQTVLRQMGGGVPAETGGLTAGERPTISLRDAKKMLRCLYDVRALQAIPAVKESRVSAEALQEQLQRLLRGDDTAAEVLLTPQERSILRESYLSRDKNKSQLADSFHMSRTTFYRHSQLALQKLSAALSRFFEEGYEAAGKQPFSERSWSGESAR